MRYISYVSVIIRVDCEGGVASPPLTGFVRKGGNKGNKMGEEGEMGKRRKKNMYNLEYHKK